MDEHELNEERKYMEGIVNNRFNYLLIIITIIIAGLVTCQNSLQFKILLIIGLGISVAIGLTITRAQLKQTILFSKLLDLFPDHPASLADRETRRKHCKHWFDFRRYSFQRMIGYVIPIVVPVMFVFALINQRALLQDEEWREIPEDIEQKLNASTQKNDSLIKVVQLSLRYADELKTEIDSLKRIVKTKVP